MLLRSLVLLVGLLVSACGAGRPWLTPLDAATHYAAIAGRELTCAEGDKGCTEAHLVKGEACLRLAAGGEQRYQPCAVRHLALGIDMSPKNASPASVQPYFESLMEALRLRRDNAQSRSESAPFAAQLESRAREFRKRFPDAPAGYYYLAAARLRRAADAAEMSPGTACRAIEDAQSLLEATPADRGLYGPELGRVEKTLRELLDVVPGCTEA